MVSRNPSPSQRALTRISQCAVERHGYSVGESPTRQLSLQPEAIGAHVEVTKRVKLFGGKGSFSELAIVQAVTCSERRAGLEKGDAEADPPEIRGRPLSFRLDERSAGTVPPG